MNPLTLQKLMPELLNLHLSLFQGLFSKAILEFVPLTYSTKHCTPSVQSDGELIPQPYHCYGILVAVVNTFCPAVGMLVAVRCMHKLFKELFRLFPKLSEIFTSSASRQPDKSQRSYPQSQLHLIQAYLSFLGLLTTMRIVDAEMMLSLLLELIGSRTLAAISSASGDASLNTAACEILIGIVTRVMRETSTFFRVANAAGFQKVIDRCRELYQGVKKSSSSLLSIRSTVYIEEMFDYFAAVSRGGARAHVGVNILPGSAFYHLEEMQHTHSMCLPDILSTLKGFKGESGVDQKYDPKTSLDFFEPIETPEDARTMLLKEREWESTKERVLSQSELHFLIFQERVDEEHISDMPPASDDEADSQEPDGTSEKPEAEETDADINFDTSNFLYQVQLGEIRKAIVLIISGSNSAAEAAHKIMEFLATKREDEALSEKLDTRAIELIICQILIQVVMHHSSVSQGLAGVSGDSSDPASDIFRIAPSAGSGSTNAFHTKYYHQIAALLCTSSITVRSIFENYFTYFYENASLLSNTNTKLIAFLYAFLLRRDIIDWKVFRVCCLLPDSPRNTVDTRVFLKYILLNLREHLDFTSDEDNEGELSRRLTMENRRSDFSDMFPFVNHTAEQFLKLKNAVGEVLPNRDEILADRIEHMRYCVIYFASVGLASISLVCNLEKKLDEFQRAMEIQGDMSGKRSMDLESNPEDEADVPQPKSSKLSLLEGRLNRIRKN